MISCISAATIMFFIGSVIALCVPLSFDLLYSLVFFLVVLPFCFCVAVYLIKKMKVFVLFIIPTFLLAGMAITTVKTTAQIRPLYPYADQEVTLSGAVCSGCQPGNCGRKWKLPGRKWGNTSRNKKWKYWKKYLCFWHRIVYNKLL